MVARILKPRRRYVVHCGSLPRIHFAAFLLGLGLYPTVSRISSSTTTIMDILAQPASYREVINNPISHICRYKPTNVLELGNAWENTSWKSCCRSAIFVCSSRYEKKIGLFRIHKLSHSLFLRLIFAHWNSLIVDFYSPWHTFV